MRRHREEQEAQRRAKARERLRRMEEEWERGATAGWGNSGRRVRTYHEPDDRVTDESGFQASYRQTVGRDDLRSLIEGRRARKLAT